jgi:hypothetical protein
MRLRSVLFLFLVGVFVSPLIGCTSKVFKHSLLVEDGKGPSAIVYFFSDNSIHAEVTPIPLDLNGDPLMRLRRATYAKVALQPGDHIVRVGDLGYDSPSPTGRVRVLPVSQTISLEAGRIYYVLIEFKENVPDIVPMETNMRAMFFVPVLIDEERAQLLMKDYELIPGP